MTIFRCEIVRALLVAMVAFTATSSSTASSKVGFRPASVPMICVYGDQVYTGARGEPCKLFFGANNDATGHPKQSDVYQWRGRSGKVVTFVGRKDDGVGWWFGKLNGKSATGFDLNREHHVFASQDGNLQFECWVVGWNHGSY